MRLGLLSPFGQQNVTDFGMVGLAVQREIGPLCGADPIPPVLAAWIKGIEPDIDPAREFAQQGKMKRRNRRRVAATVAFAIVHRPSAWHRRAPESEWTVRAARRRASRDDRANNGQRAAQCVARARNASPHPHRAASRKAAAYGPTPAP